MDPLDRFFRNLSPLLIAAAAAVLTACGPADDRQETEGGPEAAPETAPAEAGALEAERWLDEVEIGRQVDPDGAIPIAQQADEFAPGERVYVSMEVTDAPPYTAVHVVFRNPTGETVTEDEKKVPAGARFLYFDSGDTRHWQPGRYRVVVAVDGEPVVEREIELTENPLEPKGEPG